GLEPPNSNGEPAAFADVCRHAESFPSHIKNPVFKSVCGPKIPLPDARMPEICPDARNPVLCSCVAASLRTPQRKTAFDSPRIRQFEDAARTVNREEHRLCASLKASVLRKN